MKPEQLDKIHEIFCHLFQWYIQTGHTARLEFYPDDYFESVTIYTPDPEGWDGYDVQLSLDEAIEFLSHLARFD